MPITAGQITTFTNGTVADATQVNNNFNSIVTEVNNHEALTNNPHSTTATQVGAITGINNVTNAGGAINIVAGTNITVTNDNTGKNVTIASSSGGGFSVNTVNAWIG